MIFSVIYVFTILVVFTHPEDSYEVQVQKCLYFAGKQPSAQKFGQKYARQHT